MNIIIEEQKKEYSELEPLNIIKQLLNLFYIKCKIDVYNNGSKYLDIKTQTIEYTEDLCKILKCLNIKYFIKSGNNNLVKIDYTILPKNIKIVRILTNYNIEYQEIENRDTILIIEQVIHKDILNLLNNNNIKVKVL